MTAPCCWPCCAKLAGPLRVPAASGGSFISPVGWTVGGFHPLADVTPPGPTSAAWWNSGGPYGGKAPAAVPNNGGSRQPTKQKQFYLNLRSSDSISVRFTNVSDAMESSVVRSSVSIQFARSGATIAQWMMARRRRCRMPQKWRYNERNINLVFVHEQSVAGMLR